MKKIIGMLVCLFAGAAEAGVIIGATDVLSNTMGVEGGSTELIIDQSGLSLGYTSGVTDFDSYTATATHAPNFYDNAWAGSSTSGELVFDLGGVYILDSFALWTQLNENAIDEFSILVDGILAGSFNAEIGTSPNIAVQIFDLSDLKGQFVTLKVSSIHNGLAAINIGEVAFEAISVSEPSSFALLGLGLAGIGLSRKKQKN